MRFFGLVQILPFSGWFSLSAIGYRLSARTVWPIADSGFPKAAINDRDGFHASLLVCESFSSSSISPLAFGSKGKRADACNAIRV